MRFKEVQVGLIKLEKGLGGSRSFKKLQRGSMKKYRRFWKVVEDPIRF